MILGKLFSTAVLASLGNLTNTCSGPRKFQGRLQAAASRYESRKPVIITDFSILASHQAIKKRFAARRGMACAWTPMASQSAVSDGRQVFCCQVNSVGVTGCPTV